jgi:hypothetical protein
MLLSCAPLVVRQDQIRSREVGRHCFVDEEFQSSNWQVRSLLRLAALLK